jgi:hypothetical protein
VTAVIARAALVPICAEPSLRAEQTNQLVLGETAAVLETAGDWRKVQTGLDSYVGWVHAGYCAEVADGDADAWRSQAGAWSLGAAVKVGELRVRLPLRARVVLEGDTVRLPDGRRAKVVEGTVAPTEQAVPAARAKAPERWALEYFAGAPYEWGGVTPCGSGLFGRHPDHLPRAGDRAPARLVAAGVVRRAGRARRPSSRRPPVLPGRVERPHHPRGLRW